MPSWCSNIGSTAVCPEDSIRAVEARATGMETRQSAMLRERISCTSSTQNAEGEALPAPPQAELKTLANLTQAIKDLEALCP